MSRAQVGAACRHAPAASDLVTFQEVTAITFKGSRRGFAGVKPTSRGLDGYLDLQRRVEDPRIRSSAPYTKRLFVHQFRVSTADQLDKSSPAGSARLRGRTGRPPQESSRRYLTVEPG